MRQALSGAPSGAHLRALPPPPASGKYIENHGVVHNMFYNFTTKVKLPYHATLGIQSWWDSGSVPIWITAQRQVTRPCPHRRQGARGPGRQGCESGRAQPGACRESGSGDS